MTTKAESAELVLKLYDLRREKKMRKARDWFVRWFPASAEDYVKTVMDPKVGAYLRMVTSYWEMAAALVNQGCIDPEVFDATNGEHYIMFAKLEPILAELRAVNDRPTLFAQVEKQINSAPNGPERLRQTQEFLFKLKDRLQGEEKDKSAKA